MVNSWERFSTYGMQGCLQRRVVFMGFALTTSIISLIMIIVSLARCSSWLSHCDECDSPAETAVAFTVIAFLCSIIITVCCFLRLFLVDRTDFKLTALLSGVMCAVSLTIVMAESAWAYCVGVAFGAFIFDIIATAVNAMMPVAVFVTVT